MSDAKRIVQAIATLVRASYIDELPSDGDRNQWRAVGHAARHDVDSLRAALVAAESRAQRAEAFAAEIAERPCLRHKYVVATPECGRCDPCRARSLAAPVTDTEPRDAD